MYPPDGSILPFFGGGGVKNAGKRVFDREMGGSLIELAILMNNLDILRRTSRSPSTSCSVWVKGFRSLLALLDIKS